MRNLILDMKAWEADSVLFFLPTIWWLDALKRREKIIRKNALVGCLFYSYLVYVRTGLYVRIMDATLLNSVLFFIFLVLINSKS